MLTRLKKPLVIACRGDRESTPENTLPAFESAIAKGADGIELDVHYTADKQLVVHHFFNLGHTDDGTGIAQKHILDWAQLLGIEVVHLNIALLTPAFVDKLCQRGHFIYASNLDTEEEIHKGMELGLDAFSTGILERAIWLRNHYPFTI